MEILAADIGGTNSRFALFQIERNGTTPVLRLTAERRQATRMYPSFAALTASLMHPKPFYDLKRPPSVAALAVPGPVENGTFCAPPNIPWTIHAPEALLPGLERVALCNDFEAQARAAWWGRTNPADVDLLAALPGEGKPGSPTAVIGAGTGLGKALVLEPRQGGGDPLILASEGGHAEGPFGPEDGDFPRRLAKKLGRSYLDGDAVLGGTGLAHLVAYHTGKETPPTEAPALAMRHPHVFAHYASLYGRVCRNFVLDTLALNGAVLTGGMAAYLPVAGHPAFAEAFRFCPSLPGLMDRVPVFHMRSQAAGLYGAAHFGLSLLPEIF